MDKRLPGDEEPPSVSTVSFTVSLEALALFFERALHVLEVLVLSTVLAACLYAVGSELAASRWSSSPGNLKM